MVEQLVAFLFCKDCIPKRGLSKKIEIEKGMLKNSYFFGVLCGFVSLFLLHDGVKAIVLCGESYCFLRQKGWISRLFCTKNGGI